MFETDAQIDKIFPTTASLSDILAGYWLSQLVCDVRHHRQPDDELRSEVCLNISTNTEICVNNANLEDIVACCCSISANKILSKLQHDLLIFKANYLKLVI